MIIVSVDFESWAICDIKLGSWAYILHPETRILMMSWYVIGEPKHMAELWWPGQPFPPRLAHLIACGAYLQGWKAMDFERLMWHYKAVEQHGFPRIENHRWLDTMHRAAASNMPRSLDGAAKFVGSSSQKDMVGHKLMLELTNGKRTPFPLGRPEYYEKLTKLGSYCVGDSLTEADVGEQPMLAPWPTVHPWGPMPQVDRAINDRGILLDLPLIRGLANAAALEKERMDERINEITDKKVPKTTNVEGLKRWLVEHGVDLPRKEEPPPDDDEIDHVPGDADPDDVNYDGSVLKTTKYLLRKSDMVDLLLRDDLPDKVKEAIQLRAWAAKASIGKLQTMLGSVCADGRIRGALTLMGAQQTGRFSSTLVQVHNMPRNPLPDMDKIGKLFGLNDKVKDHRPMLKELSGVYLDMAVRDGTVGDHNQIREHWGPVMDFASKMLRRVIFAPEGHVLLQADFSQIEARIAVWLAGQNDILEAFAKGEDVYSKTAAGIYGIPVEQVTSLQRQIGKVARLALGFQGGVNAFAAMAVSYGVRIRATAAKPIVDGYRTSDHHVVAFWAALMAAALNAMDFPGYEFPVAPLGLISFRYDGQALRMKLPSGRNLTYWQPHVGVNKWGRREITFLRVKGKAVYRTHFYGGLATENACQSICADLLCGALVEMERQNIPVVLHVHDSVGAECREDDVDRLLPVFEQAMIIAPPWSRGLPIAGDTKISRRLS